MARDEDGAPPEAANDEAVQRRIPALEEEHADLGAAVDAMEAQPLGDRLAMQRLKKRKLALKDEIALLYDQLTPDIIA